MIEEKARGHPSAQEQLSDLFGSYKAEWLREQLFDLFTEPSYMPELMTNRPCMLVGGRGTGKTTVLRGLSYEGQFALSGRRPEGIADWSFYGMYYRVNTNRVTAFTGPEVNESDWIRLFAHYFNMLLCDQVFSFLEWFGIQSGVSVELSQRDRTTVAMALQIEPRDSMRALREELEHARTRFEAQINNVADGQRPALSVQGAPVDALMQALSELPQFRGKTFFFLLDEYENFLDYQQQVVNTIIKHSGHLYTFKIGVREMGWRRRSTLNQNEQLISPADYVRIDIAEKLEGEKFISFARDVCNGRLGKLQLPYEGLIRDVASLLPGLSEDEEAERLGVSERTAPIVDELGRLRPTETAALSDLKPLEVFFLGFWAEAKGKALVDVLSDYLARPKEWKTRYGNYKHALLFTLRTGKRGIRKFYCGWDVYTRLAASNIRYLLELVEQSLTLHLASEHALSQPVSPETQTHAAQKVGRMNLSELEGLSVHGAQLTKVLLGLGRIFQVMAANAVGHAPEVNQFRLSDSDTDQISEEDVETLLTSAVMHLALLRSPGSKPADQAETRDYDYMAHPIYSAFFVFSHRRKRKLLLSSAELLGLVRSPRAMIREVLTKQHRVLEDELPEQLALFEPYYYGGASRQTSSD
jgi:hypothetical protein